MEEKLHIRNLGPIADAEINGFGTLNVFIGESGSGKSTIMKAMAMCQWLFKMACIRTYLKNSGINRVPFRISISACLARNGLKSYMRPDTSIEYEFGGYRLSYCGGKLRGASALVPKEAMRLMKGAYISDKRGVIPNLYNADISMRQGGPFYLNETFDDFRLAAKSAPEFSLPYLGLRLSVQRAKMGEPILVEPLDGKGFAVRLDDASSGVRNAAPLHMILDYFSSRYDIVASVNSSVLSFVSHCDSLADFRPASNVGDLGGHRVNIYVEEPELSLYPSQQVMMMEYIASLLGAPCSGHSLSLTLATHSPYILNYLNVLLSRAEGCGRPRIKSGDLRVYRVGGGSVTPLLGTDASTGRPVVDAYDLSEPISDMLEEYRENVSAWKS